MAVYMQSQQSQTIATAEPTQADLERRRDIAEAWKAYRGKLKDPLKVAKDQPNDNVKTNRSSPIVNKRVSFLFNQTLKLECEDEADQEDLDTIWGDDDDKMVRLVKIAMNGAICGQTFVKLIPQDDMYPRIVILNPANIRIITLPDDCDCHVAYIIEYPTSSQKQKKQIISRVNTNLDIDDISEEDIQDTWTIENYTRQGDRGNWMLKGTKEDWLYPFPPVFTCQNSPNPNEPWGFPSLTSDLIEINKVINFVLSNIARIIKYHGHPMTWASGVGTTQIDTSVDSLIVLHSENAKLEKIAAMENFAGLLSVVDDLRSSMDELSGVSGYALGRLKELPKGNISGVALRLLFQTLIEVTILAQRLYGKLIREISRAALVMCGALSVEEYETYKIELHWANLLPTDDLAAAQTAILLQQIGVSQDTLMQELGYNSEDEAKKSAEEDAKEAEQNPPAPAPAQPLPGQPMPGQAPGQEQENAA